MKFKFDQDLEGLIWTGPECDYDPEWPKSPKKLIAQEPSGKNIIVYSSDKSIFASYNSEQSPFELSKRDGFVHAIEYLGNLLIDGGQYDGARVTGRNKAAGLKRNTVYSMARLENRLYILFMLDGEEDNMSLITYPAKVSLQKEIYKNAGAIGLSEAYVLGTYTHRGKTRLCFGNIQGQVKDFTTGRVLSKKTEELVVVSVCEHQGKIYKLLTDGEVYAGPNSVKVKSLGKTDKWPTSMTVHEGRLIFGCDDGNIIDINGEVVLECPGSVHAVKSVPESIIQRIMREKEEGAAFEEAADDEI